MLSTNKLKSKYGIGDKVRAKVIERIDQTDWIVSVDGMLIKITNQSGNQILVGQTIGLLVRSLEPAELIFL